MSETIMLGIDCGGTHTDAALLAVDLENRKARLLGSAKTGTMHDNLPASIAEVIHALSQSGATPPPDLDRTTLGTTLAINALVQGKADKVGLAVTAGPGLDPVHFVLGDNFCVVPGGLDHRGVEVDKLYLDTLEKEAAAWPERGVAAIACVGKFSPRNPEHEEKMAKVAQKASGLPVTMGHTLSGRLNFPRRIATAYYNAAVARLHNNFLDAVENGLSAMGVNSYLRLLKADGGAIPFKVSRKEPAQSILSGPAASVMGALALWPDAANGCSLLLDMGGTTTDIALILDGSPVVERAGMEILGRRTLVRSLASVSIGIGGDSRLSIQKGEDGGVSVKVGPERYGPAMAFGGTAPTLLDALNALDGQGSPLDRGDVNASVRGVKTLASEAGLPDYIALAQAAADRALSAVSKAVYDLVEGVNSKPIYTLAALKAVKQARPVRACLVGGPAECVQKRMCATLGMPVSIAPCSQVANAIGAALTIPTASLEIYADTSKGTLSAPALNYSEKIPASFNLEQAKKRACELLERKLASEGIEDAHVEVIEADLFATLDDYGRGSKDIRVACQARPGIVATLSV